jgi:hypothetical protein
MNASLRRGACLAIAAGAMALSPGVAHGQAPASAEYASSDNSASSGGYRWLRTDGAGTDAVIAQGGTVTFSVPGTAVRPHNVSFPMPPADPSCVLDGATTPSLPMPSPAGARGWRGTCTFTTPGTYVYVCLLHAAMTGTITVEAAGPPPGPGTPPPAPPTPGPAGSPPPAATAAATGLRLTRRQRGTRVRGSLEVRAAATRLEIAALVRRERLGRRHGPALVRVGRVVRTGLQPGRLAFAVRLGPAARRSLRARRTLTARVRIAATAAGAVRTAWTRTVRLRQA